MTDADLSHVTLELIQEIVDKEREEGDVTREEALDLLDRALENIGTCSGCGRLKLEGRESSLCVACTSETLNDVAEITDFWIARERIIQEYGN